MKSDILTTFGWPKFADQIGRLVKGFFIYQPPFNGSSSQALEDVCQRLLVSCRHVPPRAAAGEPTEAPIGHMDVFCGCGREGFRSPRSSETAFPPITNSIRCTWRPPGPPPTRKRQVETSGSTGGVDRIEKEDIRNREHPLPMGSYGCI